MAGMMRSLILLFLTPCFAFAQQPPDATIQALLKEVHALRVALEQSNQIGPRIQIVLARIQLQEERVRSATRQVQEARDHLAELQSRRAEVGDRIKQAEVQVAKTTDPNLRKQMEFDLREQNLGMERMNAMDQQIRIKEAESSSLLATEQGKWNEASDTLKAIERSLIPPQQ
jgi:GTPase involved in cell partitioning and DNA repair